MLEEALDLRDAIKQSARSLHPRIQELRRFLHRRPELSEQEYGTTEYLAQQITSLGLTPMLAGDGRGLWADVHSNGPRRAPRVALRGDIDALPIHSGLQTSYASLHPHVMHACGHDAHTAMVWGAMAILAQLAATTDLPIDFAARGIFQPAEETSTGGIHMIDAGALEGVTSAIALHVDPTRPVGTFGYRDGPFTAGCDVFELTVTGKAGHGARPHQTGDTIGAAATWVLDAYRQLPRHHDALDPIVINVGQINGGIAANVVPGAVHLSGTVRALSMEASEQARELMSHLAVALQWSHRVRTSLQFVRHTPPVLNDVTVCARFREAAEEIVGVSNVHAIERPSMGAEDFAFFASKVPAAMLRIGVAGDAVGNAPLHTPLFDIDETALEHGSAALALAALELSSRSPSTTEAMSDE